MGELRKHYFLDKWTTIAEVWAKRPYHFTSGSNEFEKECPFCEIRDPEKEKHREVIRVPEKGDWKIRVLKNKFPVMDTENEGKVLTDKELLHSKQSYGYQEVVVESPIHNLTLPNTSNEDFLQVLKVIAKREKEIMKDKKIEQVLAFRNHGDMSGASLEHPHAQILAFNVVPMAVANEADQAESYKKKKGSCAHCDIIGLESKGERAIKSTGNMVSFAHFAPEFPLETMILPKRHVNHLYELDEDELRDTVKLLKGILQSLSELRMSYNVVFVLSPRGRDLHMQIRVLPRFFHRGSIQSLQLFFSSITPENAAKFFRGEITAEQIRRNIE